MAYPIRTCSLLALVAAIQFFCVIIFVDSNNNSPYVSDLCDWQGSGSPSLSDSNRSVVPIYLRCSRGIIQWLYPKGGLRVVLKLGTGDKNFRGCIRVAHNSSQNVRIYLEGKRELHQIYAHDDNKNPDLIRCFVSIHSFMALFIEVDPKYDQSSAIQSQDHTTFCYDLQELTENKQHINDDEDLSECQPCSDEKLLELFCSADFVLAGKVTYFQHRPEVEFTEFKVMPTFVYRFPLKGAYVNDFNASEYSALDLQNLAADSETATQLERITLQRSLKCQSAATPRTEYLFLGKKMLDYHVITCAPTLRDWSTIAKNALKRGNNQCHISV